MPRRRAAGSTHMAAMPPQAAASPSRPMPMTVPSSSRTVANAWAGRPGEDGAGGLVVDLPVGAVGREPLVGQLAPHLDFLRITHSGGAVRGAARWVIRNESGGGGEGEGGDARDVAAPQRLDAHGVVGGVEPDRPGQGEVRRQRALGVPALDGVERGRHRDAGAAGGHHRVGPLGEPARRPQHPVAQPGGLHRRPGADHDALEVLDRQGAVRLAAPGRRRRDLLERGHLGAGHPHVAASGAHHEHAVVVGDELADGVGEGRAGEGVGPLEPVPHDDPRTRPAGHDPA